MEIRPAGESKRRPLALLSGPYKPRFRVDLFATSYFLSMVRQNEDIRFFVAYVVQQRARTRVAFPRVFYKDASLVWRSASHFNDEWIGKGDLRTVVENGEEVQYSAEQTTDLPVEIQAALEGLCGQAGKIPYDRRALAIILRRSPLGRVAPYRDFSEPRRRARSNPANLVHRGKRVAYFTRHLDPTSLRFVAGFEPDFASGVVERGAQRSRFYGGRVRRFRILSRNRKIQYLFMAGPKNAWIIPTQALTTEITSYGVRSVDVVADEDVFVPGYEWHFLDEYQNPPQMVSQIPAGFVGEPNPVDPSRSDASPWLDRLPVIQQFRRTVLRQRVAAGRR